MQQIFNYIDGKHAGPASGTWLANVNPAEGKVYSQVPDSDRQDIDLAVAAAHKAFAAWSTSAAEARCAVLLRIADLIDRDLDKLALAESIDNGKPVRSARSLDIPRAAANMRFFATG